MNLCAAPNSGWIIKHGKERDAKEKEEAAAGSSIPGGEWWGQCVESNCHLRNKWDSNQEDGQKA